MRRVQGSSQRLSKRHGGIENLVVESRGLGVRMRGVNRGEKRRPGVELARLHE